MKYSLTEIAEAPAPKVCAPGEEDKGLADLEERLKSSSPEIRREARRLWLIQDELLRYQLHRPRGIL